MNTTVSTSYHPMLPLLGRVLIAPLFLVAGIRKAMAVAGTAGYLAKLGVPAADMVVYAVIAAEILGGLLLLIGWRTRLVAWILIVFVAVATGLAHRFWEFDAAQQANQQTQFLKNLAIIGGLLFLAAFGPGRASVDKA